MRIAVCPGSFDPVTYGHLDIFKRASKLFDKVIVLVVINPDKHPSFSVEERMQMIREVTVEYPNVEVDSYSGLLINYVRDKNAVAIVKGLRAMSDFEYEFQMALMNSKLDSEIETVFMMTSSAYSYVSSSAVKQVAKFGGSIEGFVPEELIEEVTNKFNVKREEV